ncbi:MAG: hypothetical protein H0U88_07820 [Chthoniobacterales bacterium]|nr:hypothetical protein [Chthoniobacterales bacterium]
MDRTLFRYEEPYGRPRGRKANLFGWTIAILLLMGLTLAAWLGSYYIFGQPERPDSYRILQKLHKIEQPKRFQLTAAPAGEFLSGKQLHDRYSALRPAELAKKNAELARNYIRNFQQVAGLVPYVVGRFTIMEARELGPNDLFTSGMATLTSAIDYGELLLEHVYPADAQSVPLMKQTLGTGLEIKLERAHDLSAVIHAERLADGRVMITTVPLLYGSYTVTQGRGMFSLEPPFDLNMRAGWPLFKDGLRRAAEARYATYRQQSGPTTQGIPMPGLGPTPAPVTAANELIRVVPALPLPMQSPAATPLAFAASATATPKGSRVALASPSPLPQAPSAPTAVAAKPLASPTPLAMAAASAPARLPPVPNATPIPTAAPAGDIAPLPAFPAEPTPLVAQKVVRDMTLASTAGGGSWKTYPPGKMPAGRLITTSDLRDVAERGLAGERVYLRGEFVVNFAESNRAVLRPRGGMAETVLHLGAPSSTRIIVEFPSGYTPPEQGSTVNRDDARPYEITEVRKQSDGQLNVFVREIMQ